jgi:tetratricopeptide (TPR) repeat protein
MRALALAAAALTLLAPGSARADTPPDPWEAIKHPEQAQAWRLHARVHAELDPIRLVEGRLDRSLLRPVLERIERVLVQAGAETSLDVRLRFDLGEVYTLRQDSPRAVRVLAPAIADAPEHPAAVNASWALALSYARLGRANEEREAYLRYLALETDERARATALLNLAEAEMRLSHMQESIALYRDAMALAATLAATRGVVSASVHIAWGLAVALDRNGEPTASREQARIALGMDPELQRIQFSDDYFFVPAYERQYYVGLGMMEQARQRNAPEMWVRAERPWSEYVRLAAAGDRWLPLAKAHLAECKREHAAAVARSARRK